MKKAQLSAAERRVVRAARKLARLWGTTSMRELGLAPLWDAVHEVYLASSALSKRERNK